MNSVSSENSNDSSNTNNIRERTSMVLNRLQTAAVFLLQW